MSIPTACTRASALFPIAIGRKNIENYCPGSQPGDRQACLHERIRLPTRENVHEERLFAPRSLWLAGAFFSAFTLTAAAQQPALARRRPPAAAAPLPPGSPLIGRPADSEAAAKLAPIAPPPIPAAADKLPTAKLKVPAGFNIEVYASGIANARSLAEGDKGTIFVGSRLVGNVYAITTTRTANAR